MTIAEVSRKYEISADTLRYYERIGLVPPVPRSKSGIRDYDEASCGWVELMKCMRAAGVQIEALIEYVNLFQQGDRTIDARKELLKEQRCQLAARMAEMQRSLDRLDEKIDRYEKSPGFRKGNRGSFAPPIPGLAGAGLRAGLISDTGKHFSAEKGNIRLCAVDKIRENR